MNNQNFEIKNELPLKPKYDKTDGVFAVIYGLLGWLFIRFFFLYDWRTNFEFALKLYSVAYVSTVLAYCKTKGKKINKESFIWIFILYIIVFRFKIEYFFILLCRIMVAAYFTAVAGGLFCGGTSAYLIVDLWNTFIAKPFGNFFAIVPAFLTLFKKSEKKEKQPLSPAVWGVLAGVTALWFILPLLTKADNNFLSGTTDFLNHLFSGFDEGNFLKNLFIFIVSLPVACYLFGLGRGCIAKEENPQVKRDIITARENIRFSPALSLKVFLYIVCGAYLLFIGLQGQYLLGAFTGRLYGGMTYARYARTGFFELAQVSAINLSILAICNLLIRKDEQFGIKAPQLILSVLSLLLLSTAMAKMAMYITAYGLTFKRIVSSVFLIWLMLVFSLCIARLYKNFNLTKAALLTGTIMFCIMFSFDIGKYRYEYNISHDFAEKTVQQEHLYGNYHNSLMLPDKEDITVIEVRDSNGEHYEDLPYTGEIIDLLKASTDTGKTPAQDFPTADFYYTMSIHFIPQNSGDSDIATLYIYKDGDCFYIEQPYYLICCSDYDWDSILIP